MREHVVQETKAVPELFVLVNNNKINIHAVDESIISNWIVPCVL